MAERTNGQIYGALVIAVALGSGLAWAGSQSGQTWAAFPIFALCALLAFAINWLAFVPAVLAKTEHFYDLTGGLTYITVMAVAVLLSQDLGTREWLLTAMVMIWSLRLATFLFRRIGRSGGDDRFDEIKTNPPRFFMAWTLQGLWVLVTAGAALAAITGSTREPLGLLGIAGACLWLFGFALEVTADNQKSAFKQDPSNQGKFINTGLWAWSRHPNYFGEIVLWVGIALIAAPVLKGWQWVTLISPLFVTLLLTKVSGIPMLQEKAEQRWGGQADYESYKANTPVLIPRPPHAGPAG